MSTLKGKDLLSLHELTVDEMEEILELAAELKAMQKAGVQHHLLEGKKAEAQRLNQTEIKWMGSQPGYNPPVLVQNQRGGMKKDAERGQKPFPGFRLGPVNSLRKTGRDQQKRYDSISFLEDHNHLHAFPQNRFMYLFRPVLFSHL